LFFALKLINISLLKKYFYLKTDSNYKRYPFFFPISRFK